MNIRSKKVPILVNHPMFSNIFATVPQMRLSNISNLYELETEYYNDIQGKCNLQSKYNNCKSP